MRVICVDDERNALQAAERELKKIADVTEINTFLFPEEALNYIDRHGADVALLDINMGMMDGLSLARMIREKSPRTRIIFLTGYSEYAVDAFKMHVSGYLLKPATQKDIEEELNHIKNPSAGSGDKRVRVRCFGYFEVFADGVPLEFGQSKAKELFAYLIHRGGAKVNEGELCAALWADRPVSFRLRHRLRIVSADLARSLRKVRMDGILIKSRGALAVAADEVDCDYYSFLDRRPDAINSYTGEYMTQYSWADMTLDDVRRQI